MVFHIYLLKYYLINLLQGNYLILKKLSLMKMYRYRIDLILIFHHNNFLSQQAYIFLTPIYHKFQNYFHITKRVHSHQISMDFNCYRRIKYLQA